MRRLRRHVNLHDSENCLCSLLYSRNLTIERRIAAEERKAEFEVEKLRLELKARRLSQAQNGEQLNQGSVENVVRTPPLPSFVDGKDKLDEYLMRFERYASVAKGNRCLDLIEVLGRLS